MSRDDTSLQTVWPTISPRAVDHQRQLRLGHVPGAVVAHADRHVVARDAPAVGLEEQLGPLRLVDARVDVLDRRLLLARVAAAQISHARGPHLRRRLDRREERRARRGRALRQRTRNPVTAAFGSCRTTSRVKEGGRNPPSSAQRGPPGASCRVKYIVSLVYRPRRDRQRRDQLVREAFERADARQRHDVDAQGPCQWRRSLGDRRHRNHPAASEPSRCNQSGGRNTSDVGDDIDRRRLFAAPSKQ